MSISYRSPIYYFHFKISPSSYGRKSDHGSFIQVFLEKLTLDHDPISIFQQEFGIHIFIHDLAHLLFTDVKILSGLTQGQHILFPVGKENRSQRCEVLH